MVECSGVTMHFFSANSQGDKNSSFRNSREFPMGLTNLPTKLFEKVLDFLILSHSCRRQLLWYLIRKDRDECRDGTRLEYCIRMYRQGLTDDPFVISQVVPLCRGSVELSKKLELTELFYSDFLAVADIRPDIETPRKPSALRRVFIGGWNREESSQAVISMLSEGQVPNLAHFSAKLNAKAFKMVAANCPAIEYLDIPFSDFGPDGLTALCEEARSQRPKKQLWVRLRMLNLTGCRGFLPAAEEAGVNSKTSAKSWVNAILRDSSATSSFRDLFLSCCSELSDNDLVSIRKEVGKDLRILSVNCCDAITSVALEVVGTSCPKLEQFRVHDVPAATYQWRVDFGLMRPDVHLFPLPGTENSYYDESGKLKSRERSSATGPELLQWNSLFVQHTNWKGAHSSRTP